MTQNPAIHESPVAVPAAATEPPAGPPWDLHPNEAPVVLLDIEMTGLDPERDAVIEVAFVRTVGGRVVDEFASLVSAEIASEPAALAVHGIDPAQLSHAPPFAAIADRVASLLAGAVPVAHGATLDVAFLSRALAAAGRDPGLIAFVLDTVTLARRAVAAPRYGLGELCAALQLPPRRWHRAREDVAALEALFPRLLAEFAAPTMRDLWDVRIGQRDVVRVRGSIAARLTELFASQRPCTLVARTPGRAPFRLRGTVEYWRPPHVRLATSDRRGGLKLVRADRILRIE